MAYGRLNYQFSGIPKPAACENCSGRGSVLDDGRATICPKCLGSRMAEVQMVTRLQVRDVRLSFSPFILLCETTDGRTWTLNGSPSIEESKLTDLISKVKRRGSIDPRHWSEVPV
jgi:hypothetical protein